MLNGVDYTKIRLVAPGKRYFLFRFECDKGDYLVYREPNGKYLFVMSDGKSRLVNSWKAEVAYLTDGRVKYR